MFERLAIPGLVLATPKKHGDARGYFYESFRSDIWGAAGINVHFVQDNQSLSVERGVIRGLHFQTPPRAQAKLVRCTRGSIFDVAVDIRAQSPTYGQHFAVELNADNALQIFIPVGFAHGFCTLEPNTELQYRCSDYYAPDCDGGLAFDDPDLAIAWPVEPGSAILSEKDTRQPRFETFVSPFAYSV